MTVPRTNFEIGWQFWLGGSVTWSGWWSPWQMGVYGNPWVCLANTFKGLNNPIALSFTTFTLYTADGESFTQHEESIWVFSRSNFDIGDEWGAKKEMHRWHVGAAAWQDRLELIWACKSRRRLTMSCLRVLISFIIKEDDMLRACGGWETSGCVREIESADLGTSLKVSLVACRKLLSLLPFLSRSRGLSEWFRIE